MILWMIIMVHAVGDAFEMELTLYNLWHITDASLIPEGVHAAIGKDGYIQTMGINAYLPDFLFFFMPWFFYKSGEFFTKRGIKEELQKDYRKLIRPLLLWSAIGYILYVLFLYLDGSFSIPRITYQVIKGFFFKGYIELNIPLWFLFSLFIVRQIANIMFPTEEDKYFWIKCLCIIIGSYGVAFGAYCLHSSSIPRWLANSSAGLSFFCLGYCLRKYETKLWLLIPCAMIYITCLLCDFSGVDMFSNGSSSSCIYLLSLPASIAGIVSFNMLCRLISQYLPKLSLPFEYVGKYAMIIYVSHGLLYLSIGNILRIYNLTTLMPYCLWLFLGAYIIFLPLFCFLSTKIRR